MPQPTGTDCVLVQAGSGLLQEAAGGADRAERQYAAGLLTALDPSPPMMRKWSWQKEPIAGSSLGNDVDTSVGLTGTEA